MNDGVEHVALLHGWGRTSRSMAPMAGFLERNGFRASLIGYPSRRYEIGELSVRVRERLETLIAPGERIHFVTHSMGGIVLRRMVADAPELVVGRVVMLCPPNRGSVVVDRLSAYGLYRWAMGPGGLQLGTGEASVPLRLGAAPFDLGVIAGDRIANPIFSRMVGEPNDGTVAISSMRIAGTRAFATVHATHTFIMRNAAAQANTLAFLRSGAFLGG